jgi:hypothetical protein
MINPFPDPHFADDDGLAAVRGRLIRTTGF